MSRLQSAALLLVLAVSCTLPRFDARQSIEDAPFPHPAKGFDDPLAHGAEMHRRGAESCLQCHGQAGSTAPACATCHEPYPHVQGWFAGDKHGAGLLEDDADFSRCTSCHEQTGQVAADRYACRSCHASFPHPDDWELAGQHGTYAIARPDIHAVCGTCHGADLSGGRAGVACNQCHQSWPHSVDWHEATVHGPSALDHLQECASCHATSDVWDGGSAEVGCSRCHQVYPHQPTWRVEHATLADKVGEPVCMRCHEAADGPSTMLATCAARCHGGDQ